MRFLKVVVKDKITSEACIECQVNIRNNVEVLLTDSSGICFLKNIIADTVSLIIHSKYESMLLLDVPFPQKGDTLDVLIELKVSCEFEQTSDSVCPKCHNSDRVKPISYGLMIFESKKEVRKYYRKYYDGGCGLSKCQPSWYCKRDDLKY